MEPGGKICIRLGWDGTKISQVSVAPRNSVTPASLLTGKSGQQAVNMIPLLFSLCGKAQGVAGAMALEAATGVTPPRETGLWRNRLVQAEAIQESLWRILLDLPKAAGREPMMAPYVELRRRLARGLSGVLSEDTWKIAGGRIAVPDGLAWNTLAEDIEIFLSDHVLGIPLRAWLDICTRQELESWLETSATPIVASLGLIWRGRENGGENDTRLLPALDQAEILEHIVARLETDGRFAQIPQWQGDPAETGPMARMKDHPLLRELLRQDGPGVFVRLLARLLEIATLTAGLNATEAGLSWLGSTEVRTETGAAWVQTARGLLVHWLRLEQGKVADYRILAPTEWNFHPEGAYARGLVGRSAASRDEARAAAEWLLLALDPCVAYEIELNDA
jgi:uptake hydrogenase large subunit